MILVAAAFAILVLVLVFVVPKLAAQWAANGVRPPLAGRVLMLMRQYLFTVIVVGVGFLFWIAQTRE
jgi:hypothetical protein